jgi:PAS domain S-box-containing protein
MVSPQLAYIQFHGGIGEAPIKLAHLDGDSLDAGAVELLSSNILGWAAEHGPDAILVLPGPAASSSHRICVYPLGAQAEYGVLAAGFTGPITPTQTQRTLLSLAANQALTACRNRILHQRQARLYDAVLSSTPDLVYVFDLNHRFTYANAALLKLWGRTWEEAIGRNCLELGYEPWHAAMHDREIEQVRSLKQPIRGEVPFPGTQGHRFYDYIFVPVFDASGELEAVAGTARDVTERKQAEHALHTQGRLDANLEAAEIATWTWDVQTDRVVADKNLARLFSVSVTEAQGGPIESYYRAIHPEDRPGVEVAVVRALETGEVYETEYRIVQTDGSVRWVAARGKVIFDETGKPIRFPGLLIDITDRKQNEQTLRFLVDLNAATQGLADPDKIMEVTARILVEHLGVDRCAYAEVEDQEIFVITGDYPRGVPSLIGRWPVRAFGSECTRLMLANEPFVVADVDTDPRIGPADLPIYRASNIKAGICVPLHANQKFTAAMAVHQPSARHWTPQEIELVTLAVRRCWESLERARTVRGLRESEQRLRFMAESMPQKIFTAKPDGAIDYFNPQWIEFTGLTLEQIRGWGWKQLVHPEDLEENLYLWNRSLKTGENFEMEHRFRRKDGEYRWHLTRAQAMRDPEGNVLMWIGSNTEIHDQKQAEEELERTVAERTAKLRETVQHLETFSYSVAHDMRAPLRAMQGFSRMLQAEYGEKIPGEGQEYLRRIANSASRLDSLIQDVLNYSKIVRAELKLEPVEPQAFIEEIIESYPNLHRPHGDIRIEGPIPAVLANPAAITQVFSNLLGNSVKFVEPGVLPQVRIWAETISDETVRLWFEDNGIGIPKEVQGRIFVMFQRINPPGRYEGTGIGLTIVRTAVERMGGKVGVESVPGMGSRFWVELQRAKDR